MIEKQTMASQQRRDRIISEANYIIRKKCTVREAAKHFGMSKSTIHTDMRYALPKISEYLTTNVGSVLDENNSVKHLRGGEATRIKYIERVIRGRRIKKEKVTK